MRISRANELHPFLHAGNMADEQEKAPAIGIDLGTSFCRVGVYHGGKITIIKNEWDTSATPSYVAFTDTACLVGETARSQATTNYTNTVFGVKRLFGRRGDDPALRSSKNDWACEIVAPSTGGLSPKINIPCRGNRGFLPEEICYRIFTKLKQTAETFLGKTVTDAVVAVPTHFNRHQWKLVKEACALAGLNVLRITNEAVCAGVAYGFEKKVAPETRVLVFNLGGGFLSVSVLTVENGMYEVHSASGGRLGGEDFVTRMVDHLLEKGKLPSNKETVCRLRKACEHAKRELSFAPEASIQLDDLNYHVTITRATFEKLNADLFQRLLEPVDKALRDATLDRSQIQEIVLVGGSTRIPKVRQLLQDFFKGKELNTSINPDEAVAYGAAVNAAILSKGESEDLENQLLLDITPFSLGIETVGGMTVKIIHRNSTIAKKETRHFTTQRDHQHTMLFKVYEGENDRAKDNLFLGRFAITGIRAAPRGVPQIDVTFDVSSDVMAVSVTAMDVKTECKAKIVISGEEQPVRFTEGFEELLPVIPMPQHVLPSQHSQHGQHGCQHGQHGCQHSQHGSHKYMH